MSSMRDLWLKWKSLKLPWRKRFLVGMDLEGRTYWEFKDALNAQRLRRTVKYQRSAHYSDVQVSPQWHQWLRYTRRDPPSIQEQQAEVIRQAQMKQLARVADERWASKASFLDKPSQQGLPTPSNTPEGKFQARGDETFGAQDLKQQESIGKSQDASKSKNPWKQQRGGPSEQWQPDTWSPGPARR